MKKFIIIFIVVMVVVLGLFFWSVSNDSAEKMEDGTLVTAPAEQSERGESNV